MAEAKTAVAHKPVWTDLSTSDAEGARKFYSAVFGWKVEVNPDPQYGGYALAKAGGKDVAGIGPKQMDEAPTAWTVYIGTPDAAETAKKAEAAGAKIIAPVMEVGDQGHMAIIQDPSGAYLGLWQAGKMQGSQSTGSNAMVPAQVPSYWMVYFNVDNVDKAFDKVVKEGGKEMLAPQDMPGGRFAIVSDPQGASFGLLKMEEPSR